MSFLLNVYQFGAAAPAVVTWNSADKSASMGLSGGNLVATGGSASDQGVRATTGLSSGKRYFELTYNTHAGGNAQLGLSPSSFAVGNAPSSGANIAVLKSSGDVVVNTVTQATLGAYAAGAVLSFAIDLDADLLWVRLNGGLWNASGTANPATATGGISTSALASTLFPLTYYFNGVGNVTTANFGATAFSYSVPSGFSQWG